MEHLVVDGDVGAALLFYAFGSGGEISGFVDEIVVGHVVLHGDESDELVVFAAVQDVEDLPVGGAVVDVFGLPFFFCVVHFELGDEGVVAEVGEGEVALVHATVEGVNSGGFVAFGLEIGGDGGDVAGFWNERGVGDGVDPVVGEAGDGLELDVGGAAAVVEGVHAAAGVFLLEAMVIWEDISAGVGVEIFEGVALEADTGVIERFVEDDDDVDVFVGDVVAVGIALFGEFVVGGVNFGDFLFAVAVWFGKFEFLEIVEEAEDEASVVVIGDLVPGDKASAEPGDVFVAEAGVVAGEGGEAHEAEAGDDNHGEATRKSEAAPPAFLVAFFFEVKMFGNPDIYDDGEGDDEKDGDDEADDGADVDEF